MTDTADKIWLTLHYESGQFHMLRPRQLFRQEGFVLEQGYNYEDEKAHGHEDWEVLEDLFMARNPAETDRATWRAFRAAAERLGYFPAREPLAAQEGATKGFREASVAVSHMPEPRRVPEARSRMVSGPPLRYTAETFPPETPKYPGDVGIDLSAAKSRTVYHGQVTYIPTGVRFAAPKGYWILITGRSSAAAKLGLAVVPGVIDNGYRGEMLAGVYPIGPDPVFVEQGTRLAQAILIPAVTPRLEEVKVLPTSDRGENGFGSTGGH